VDALEDPYSIFLNPEEMSIFEEDLSGEFIGIGIEVDKEDNILTVVSPLRGTPAYKAGLLPGDRIIKIDGNSTFELSIDEAVKLIRGPKKTVVTLTIERGLDEILEIAITRDVISIPILEKEFITDDIFHISLLSFDVRATQEFGFAIGEFLHSSASKLILDLRNNPGGFLESAIDISSLFIPEGKIITIEDMGKGTDIPHYSKGYNVIKNKKDFEMVVLINKGSASASEILAGALSEHNIATLVGEPSFGKGSVQELVPITKDTALKITVAKWLTPERHQISEGGLTPDIVIEGEDAQLEKAIEILEK